jgi:hypothetical protein
MSALKRRLEKIERRRSRQELPPLIIRENISEAEARQIEQDWIKEHGRPGPLIITARTQGYT